MTDITIEITAAQAAVDALETATAACDAAETAYDAAEIEAARFKSSIDVAAADAAHVTYNKKVTEVEAAAETLRALVAAAIPPE